MHHFASLRITASASLWHPLAPPRALALALGLRRHTPSDRGGRGVLRVELELSCRVNLEQLMVAGITVDCDIAEGLVLDGEQRALQAWPQQ